MFCHWFCEWVGRDGLGKMKIIIHMHVKQERCTSPNTWTLYSYRQTTTHISIDLNDTVPCIVVYLILLFKSALKQNDKNKNLKKQKSF